MSVIPKKKIDNLINNNIHLRKYLDNIKDKYGIPEFYDSLPNDLKNNKYINIIYPTKGFLFTHLFRTPDMEQYEYNAIEPKLDEFQNKLKKDILYEILRKIPEKEKIYSDQDLQKSLEELCNEIITIDEKKVNIKKSNEKKENQNNIFNKKDKKIRLNSIEKKIIDYYIIKEFTPVPSDTFKNDFDSFNLQGVFEFKFKNISIFTT